MRVFICIDSLGVGGKERQAVELIKGLASVPDIDCRVVCFGGDDFYLDDLVAAGVPIDFVVRKVRWDVGVFQKLRRLIKAHRPVVIHTNGLVSSFYCLPLAKQWHIPLVNGSIRNAFTDGDCRWKLERFLLNSSDYRMANSRAGLRSRGFSEEDPRNIVIYNGFDMNRMEFLNARSGCASIATTSATKVVGMVAEFNRYKDYLTFLEAARVFNRKRQNVMFLAVGDGDTLKECQAAAMGLANVRFLGKRKDVEELVQTFDIGVLCTFVEGLSNSIMEYMALGKPVVATEGGGTRELVTDGVTGFLVRPRDPSTLAAAIEYLIDHPEIGKRMGDAGHAKLRRNFSLARMVDETLALYRRAAANSGGAGLRNKTTVL